MASAPCPRCEGTGLIWHASPRLGIDEVEPGMCGERSLSRYYACTRQAHHANEHTVRCPVVGVAMTWR